MDFVDLNRMSVVCCSERLNRKLFYFMFLGIFRFFRSQETEDTIYILQLGCHNIQIHVQKYIWKSIKLQFNCHWHSNNKNSNWLILEPIMCERSHSRDIAMRSNGIIRMRIIKMCRMATYRYTHTHASKPQFMTVSIIDYRFCLCCNERWDCFQFSNVIGSIYENILLLAFDL